MEEAIKNKTLKSFCSNIGLKLRTENDINFINAVKKIGGYQSKLEPGLFVGVGLSIPPKTDLYKDLASAAIESDHIDDDEKEFWIKELKSLNDFPAFICGLWNDNGVLLGAYDVLWALDNQDPHIIFAQEEFKDQNVTQYQKDLLETMATSAALLATQKISPKNALKVMEENGALIISDEILDERDFDNLSPDLLLKIKKEIILNFN